MARFRRGALRRPALHPLAPSCRRPPRERRRSDRRAGAGRGRLLVEDFAFEEADDASLAWFRALASRLPAEPLPDWGDHDHDLHSAGAIAAALGAKPRGCAYYFRYLEAAAPGLAAAALAEEEQAIAAGLIRPLGRRWVVAAA